LQQKQRENNQYNKLNDVDCCVAEVKKAKPEKTEAEQGEYHHDTQAVAIAIVETPVCDWSFYVIARYHVVVRMVYCRFGGVTCSV